MAKEKKQTLTPKEYLAKVLVPGSEQPYAVPSNWVWTRLRYINEYHAKSVDPSNDPDDLFELYSVPSCETNYPEIIAGSDIGSTKQTVRKNDVLLCKINPRINRVWIVAQHTDNPLIASSEWIIVRNDRLFGRYLMWCFQSHYFREYMLSNVSGVGGSLMRAQPKYVAEYPIPLPPLAEQRRIVERIESLFEKLDRAKELAQNALDSFETRKAAILHKALTGELTAQWREQNGVGMESWDVKPLIDIIVEKPRNGYSPVAVSYPTPTKTLTLSATTSGIFKSECFKYVDVEVERDSYLWLKKGDILIQRANSLEYVGVSTLYTGEDNGYIYPDLMMKIKARINIVETSFLVYYLSYGDAREYFRNNATGTAGNMPKINQTTVSRVPVKLPTIAEQQKIVSILDGLFDKEQRARELCDVIDKLDLMKKAILARAFRGQLATNDPNEESSVKQLIQVLAGGA